MPAVPETDLKRPVSQFTSPVDAAVQSGQTVAQALEFLRSRPLGQKIFYIYVVDEAGRLVGVMPTRSFLVAEPRQLVDNVMITSVISVTADTPLEEVMEVFAIYRLLALPVVDGENKLLGAVDVQLYAEEMVDLAQTHQAAEVFQLIGVSAEASKYRSPVRGFRLRMPWLVFNIVGGLACALISWFFGRALQEVLLISMFVPLVLALSESISMQSMTLVMQMLHGATVPWKQLYKRLVVEWKTAMLIGLASGLSVGAAAMLWRQGVMAPGVIAASILASMTIAASIGVLLPATLHALRLDPKLAAGPLVLMSGDICALTLYLGLATWLLV